MEELEIIKVAYGNCANDLRRTRNQLQQVEYRLRQLAHDLLTIANRIADDDNPGTGGSGGS